MNLDRKRKIDIVSFDDIVNASILSVSAATMATIFENDILSSSGFNNKVINRTRQSVEIIFRDLGPIFTRRTYRMNESSFWKLLGLLKIYDNLELKLFRMVPNGIISLSARLSMALRWFAGGCSYDISLNHGVHYQEVMKSVWIVVDLVNLCEELKIHFSSTHLSLIHI